LDLVPTLAAAAVVFAARGVGVEATAACGVVEIFKASTWTAEAVVGVVESPLVNVTGAVVSDDGLAVDSFSAVARVFFPTSTSSLVLAPATAEFGRAFEDAAGTLELLSECATFSAIDEAKDGKTNWFADAFAVEANMSEPETALPVWSSVSISFDAGFESLTVAAK
jgi:hypothetical protein